MVTVLVVDDEPMLRDCVAYDLRAVGFTVVEAGDGAEGLRLVCAGGIDLVVTDIQMPRMTGIEFIYHLRERALNLPVVAMTGNFDTYAKRALEAGAASVVAKPSGLWKIGAMLGELAQPLTPPSEGNEE